MHHNSMLERLKNVWICWVEWTTIRLESPPPPLVDEEMGL